MMTSYCSEPESSRASAASPFSTALSSYRGALKICRRENVTDGSLSTAKIRRADALMMRLQRAAFVPKQMPKTPNAQRPTFNIEIQNGHPTCCGVVIDH